jgi:hypothetical protein
MTRLRPVPPPINRKQSTAKPRRPSRAPAAYFREIPRDIHRAALQDFLTKPRESYTRTEIGHILGHPFLPSNVRRAELVQVPGSKPARYTTESIYRALAADEVSGRLVFFGGLRRVLPILAEPDARSVTLPVAIVHEIIGLMFRKHEQSLCEHEWAEPIGDHPPACCYCGKASAPSPHEETHTHCTITLNDWPFVTQTPRHLCIECFEADAPHPGMKWAPKRLPLADAREMSLRAMNEAWARVENILTRACRD